MARLGSPGSHVEDATETIATLSGKSPREQVDPLDQIHIDDAQCGAIDVFEVEGLEQLHAVEADEDFLLLAATNCES